MVINTNLPAMNSARLLATSSTNLAKSLARLSSGSKIVTPEDDAAGLAQTIKFDAQINRNTAANTNVGNAISYSQTQDGFLQKVQKALDRMSELSMLARDVTKTDADRSNYSLEFTQLQQYISNVGSKEFNGVSLFSADQLGVSIDSDCGTFGMANVDVLTRFAADEIFGNHASLSTTVAACDALDRIKTAIQDLAKMRADVGANIQRLNLTSEQLTILNENLTAANSGLPDDHVIDIKFDSTGSVYFATNKGVARYRFE